MSERQSRKDRLHPEEKYTLDEAIDLIAHSDVKRRLLDLKADREARTQLELDHWEEPSYESIDTILPTEPAWLIRDYIESGTVGMLNGIFGSAKSFLALDWACCVASGTSWFDHPIGEGKVIYVAAEGAQGIGRRYAAWRKENRSVPPDNLTVIKSPVQFGVPAAVDWLVKRIIDCDADFLIIDTLARSIDGLNENDSVDMAKVITALYKFRDARGENERTTILVVHHTGWGDKTRSRGSSRLPSDTDYSFTTERVEGKPFTLKCTKLKEDKIPATFSFNLTSVPLDKGMTSCVITPATGANDNTDDPGAEDNATEAAITAALRLLDGQSNAQLVSNTGKSQPSISRATRSLKDQGRIRGKYEERGDTQVAVWRWYLDGKDKPEISKLGDAKKKSRY